jgi:KTSC domain
MPRENVKIDWNEVESSNVHSIAFDAPTKTLAVRYVGGGLYSYMHADEEIFSGLLQAESVGKYLNAVVKSQLPYTRWDSEDELIKHLSI